MPLTEIIAKTRHQLLHQNWGACYTSILPEHATQSLDAAERAEIAEAERDRARAVLEYNEWGNMYDTREKDRCPQCDRDRQHGHHSRCAWKAELDAMEEGDEEKA